MGERNLRRRLPQQGVIDCRPSGVLRVRVDAGIDPVTGRRYRLVEHVSADTPNKEAVAEQIRVRLVNQINERRQPRTNATVSQLLDRHLDNFDGAYTTLYNYRSLRRNHVERFIGRERAAHRTTQAHSCDRTLPTCARPMTSCTSSSSTTRPSSVSGCACTCTGRASSIARTTTDGASPATSCAVATSTASSVVTISSTSTPTRTACNPSTNASNAAARPTPSTTPACTQSRPRPTRSPFSCGGLRPNNGF